MCLLLCAEVHPSASFRVCDCTYVYVLLNNCAAYICIHACVCIFMVVHAFVCKHFHVCLSTCVFECVFFMFGVHVFGLMRMFLCTCAVCMFKCRYCWYLTHIKSMVSCSCIILLVPTEEALRKLRIRITILLSCFCVH